MDLETIKQEFERRGIFRAGHFEYTSGRHGDVYINKDAIYPDTYLVNTLCQTLSDIIWPKYRPEVVVGPAMGGVILSTWLAFWLSEHEKLWSGQHVPSVYAEKERGGFVLKRGFDKIVAGKSVVIVEDVVTTGASAKKVAEAVREAGGNILLVVSLVNRGNAEAKDIGVPHFFSLLSIPLPSWQATDCPLCRRGVPIDMDFGHGAKSA